MALSAYIRLLAVAAWMVCGRSEEAAVEAARCLAGCCATDCGSCMEYSDRLRPKGSCRWCPETQTCHNFLSPLNTCMTPINSPGQCWGAQCPLQLGSIVDHTGLHSMRLGSLVYWAYEMVGHVNDPLQSFPMYAAGETGIFDLSSGMPLDSSDKGSAAQNIVITGAADWGSGTCEARVISALMAAQAPALTLHLGDVYHVGLPEQFDRHVAGLSRGDGVGVAFPKGSHSTFLMNGNHEMISGGKGLMVNGFRYSGQKATFAAWQSDHWRLIALDTAYESYQTRSSGSRILSLDAIKDGSLIAETEAPQPQQVIDWLVHTVKLGDPSDKRGIVLFSHHQPMSRWERAYTATAQQLNRILPAGKTVLWFFGHEHRLAMYEKVQLQNTSYHVYPRMVGNGGFADTPSDPQSNASLQAYDKRIYQQIPTDLGQEVAVGFNGFFKLRVNGPDLEAAYISGKCKNNDCNQGYSEDSGSVLASEVFSVDRATGGLSQKWTYLGGLTNLPVQTTEAFEVALI